MKTLSYLVCALLSALMCGELSAAAKICTTNDVDVLFTPVAGESIAALQRRCWEAGIRHQDAAQADVRRYAFEKILEIPIETNRVGFAYRFLEKAEWIEMSEESVGIRFQDAELRKILKTAAETQPLSTNELMRLRALAVRRDTEKWGRAVNYIGSPYANFGRWQRHRRRILAWNEAVADFRRRLVAFVCRKYDELHADVPEAARRAALRALLGEYGLSLPNGASADGK